MDMNFMVAIKNIFTVTNILLAAGGTLMGIIFGALPGFTAAMGVAVLLPITFGMPPASGLILLGALFGGAMYGGSISAILINTPGTPAAAATILDGHPMAKKGLAGEALREAVFASFLGGIFGVTVLLLFAPPLAKISLMFGPPEYFLLAIFGLTIIAAISEESLFKGLIAGVLGLLISTIGMDPLLGTPRFTMGIVNLIDGVQLVPAMIGLFSIPETLALVSSYLNKDTVSLINTTELRKIKVGFPNLRHIKSHAMIYLKSSMIGTYVGMLPGAGGSIASFMAYNEAKRSSKHPEKFGTGISEGIAASESANNAMASGALIPMLTLGVPGDSVAAIIMGGLMVHGLEPGAQLFARNGDIVYTFIIALYLANVMMLLFGTFCAPYFTIVTNTPKHILSACVMMLTVIGSYALRGNVFDVYVMITFGLLGYIMKSHGFSVIPTVLGIILGPIAEKGLNGTIAISHGENILLFMLSRPISLILIVFTLLSVGVPLYRRIKGSRGKTAGNVE
ncbi:MAG: tripartite tricarboxylate transporter permease [Firmicutes bacterium]|nr:tripartite tricarboxylate transporter permease [Bacillota bacterium]NSW92146.1 tripartite tricarboxylate transporter permease [Bacillota bacterium]